MNNIIESLQEAVIEMRRQNMEIEEVINRFKEREGGKNTFDLRKLNKELLDGRYTEKRETDRPVNNIRRVRAD